MKYNFTDCTPRNDVGSGKWNEMKNYTIHKPEEVIPFSVADMEFQIAPEIRDGLKTYIDTYVPGYANPTKHTSNPCADGRRITMDGRSSLTGS